MSGSERADTPTLTVRARNSSRSGRQERNDDARGHRGFFALEGVCKALLSSDRIADDRSLSGRYRQRDADPRGLCWAGWILAIGEVGGAGVHVEKKDAVHPGSMGPFRLDREAGLLLVEWNELV